jgi:hypothetical protein
MQSLSGKQSFPSPLAALGTHMLPTTEPLPIRSLKASSGTEGKKKKGGKVTSPNFAKSFLATSILLSTSDGDFIHHNFPLEIRRIPPIIQGNLLLLAASHQFPYLSIALSNRRESLYLPWCFRHTRNWTKHYLRAHATTTLRELSQSCRE